MLLRSLLVLLWAYAHAHYQAAPKWLWWEVHGREVTSGELEALVHEGVVEHHPELVKANPALETMATACVSFDGDFVCTEELSASPEAYLWLGIDMDSDAGFCYTLFWGVDVDFSFEITTGLCVAGLGDYGSYEFAKEATIAYSGVMAGLLQVGVAAEVTSFDLEASIRMKAERDRAAVDAPGPQPAQARLYRRVLQCTVAEAVGFA